MKHSEHTHAHAFSHPHAHDCACDHDRGHDHGHEHSHDQNSLPLANRWVLSILMVTILLVLLRSFIVGQMLVRVTSYSANSSYNDAVRICKKIIIIDKDNKQAWTSLGYAYMDMSQVDKAIPVFEKVLLLNPEDKGAASFELGQAYYLKGDFTRAIECFERVRSAGPRAAALLEADILKYRHGTLGFRSLNSMQTLLGLLLDCYKRTGNSTEAAVIQKEYDLYKNKHSRILF
jgi:tetratricopeptide (TPR) repeat protein